MTKQNMKKYHKEIYLLKMNLVMPMKKYHHYKIKFLSMKKIFKKVIKLKQKLQY